MRRETGRDVQVAVFLDSRDFSGAGHVMYGINWWCWCCEEAGVGGGSFCLSAYIYQVCIPVHIVDTEYIFKIIYPLF